MTNKSGNKKIEIDILSFYPPSLLGEFSRYLEKSFPPDVRLADIDFEELVKEFKDYYEATILGGGKLGRVEIEVEGLPDVGRRFIKATEIRYGRKSH